MAALNRGTIVKALEPALKGPRQDWIREFLKACGTSAATLKRLRLGVPQKLSFRAVPEGLPLSDALTEIPAQPLRAAHKTRFVMVTDFATVMAHDRMVDDTLTLNGEIMNVRLLATIKSV